MAERSAERTVLVATATTMVIGGANHVARGGKVPVRVIAAAFAAGAGLALLAEGAPELASALAILMATSTVFRMSPELQQFIRKLGQGRIGGE